MPALNLTQTDLQIGCIVALKSHPYFHNLDTNKIVISGDANSLSPAMVVTEILAENKSLFDEHIGMEISSKNTFQCKCIWYSSKSGQFEDTWISSRLLKIISLRTELTPTKSLPFGTSVIFKTNSIELGKKKISLKQTDSIAAMPVRTTTASLNFTSPVMQIIGTTKSDSKEPFIDHKTGKIKREISTQLFKCKYYNHVAEKFSEVVVPMEALEIIKPITPEYLDQLDQQIRDRCFLRIDSPNENLKRSILKPLRLIYEAGKYYIEGKDYLENKIIEVLLEFEGEFEPIESLAEELPLYKMEKDTLNFTPITPDTLRNLDQTKYWRINYKDRNDKVTTRTISEHSYLTSEEGVGKVVFYLKSKCLLAGNQFRSFRIDRIDRIQVLDLEYGDNVC